MGGSKPSNSGRTERLTGTTSTQGRTILKNIAAGCGILILVVVLSIGGLVLGGVLKVGNTILDREITVQSQQYITTHNQQILDQIIDYNNTTDPGRRQAIVNKTCLLANEIPGHVGEGSRSFVSLHCNL